MRGGFGKRGADNNNPGMRGFAIWAGMLCTLLITPQIWQISKWLSRNVLEHQFGYDMAFYLTYVVFGLICLMAASMSRMGLETSIVMFLVFAFSKLPFI